MLLEILEEGTKEAIIHTNKILNEVKEAVGISYFADEKFKKDFN